MKEILKKLGKEEISNKLLSEKVEKQESEIERLKADLKQRD